MTHHTQTLNVFRVHSHTAGQTVTRLVAWAIALLITVVVMATFFEITLGYAGTGSDRPTPAPEPAPNYNL
jgi:hypothetical protein